MRPDHHWQPLAPFVSLLVLGAAGLAVHRMLASLSYHALLAEVQAIPIGRALAALAFMLGSFAALGAYDWLALRHITENWKNPPISWHAAKAQFAIQFAERFVLGE